METRGKYSMCVSVSHIGGKTESIAVREISYREKLYIPAPCVSHTRVRLCE